MSACSATCHLVPSNDAEFAAYVAATAAGAIALRASAVAFGAGDRHPIPDAGCVAGARNEARAGDARASFYESRQAAAALLSTKYSATR